MPPSRDDYVFFWRETAKHGWASQWYHSPFRARIQLQFDVNGKLRTIDSHDEHVFPTAEHWMMACKALLFDDAAVFADILATDARDARGVKALGRAVRGFDEAVWVAARGAVVREGNLHKFRAHEEIRQALFATGARRLVEASPRDRVWGIGFGEARALEEDVRRRWGLNLLGKALEEVRAILRREEEEIEPAKAAA
ncbi:hypothetical protein EIP86_009030 [Pleurotus ostreatoroseus]|nr:hypothetical protein EIP86_009030 [Pleurotus ostreatoroseus]